MTKSSPPAVSPAAARIHGLALMLAPLLLLASTTTFIYENGINDGVIGGTIGVWSAFALIVGFAGLYRLVEPATPRAAPVCMAIALVGFTAGVGFNVQAIYLGAYGNDLLTDLTDGAAPELSPVAMLAFLPWGWLAPLGFVLTGALLWRTRAVPAWSAALLLLGGVLFIASRPARIEALALACDATLVAALVPIGWSLAFGRLSATLRSRPSRSDLNVSGTRVDAS